MSPHHPRLLLLAPPARHRALAQRLEAEAGALHPQVTCATPDTALCALERAAVDLVVLAPDRTPDPGRASELARSCAPAPLVLVWPEAGAPPPAEIADVAACVHGAERLAETVAAIAARTPGSPGGNALRDILAKVTEPLLLVASDGNVVAANPRFAEFSGWSDAALVGHPLAALLPDEVAANVTVAHGHEWAVKDVRLRARDDDDGVTVDVRASVVRLTAGRATWLLRFKRAEGARLPASPAAAATALDALGRRAQHAGSRVGGAQVRLIGLGRARQILGDRWPRFQQHVQLVCESTIDHELGPNDVAMATRTGDYLVCFACDDDAEADRRADRLQATIDRRLFGQDGAPVSAGKRGRAALDAMSVEVEAAVLPAELDTAPEHIAERFARECATRRRERLAEFNGRLDGMHTSGDLELLAMASHHGTLPSLVRAHWFPADHARLQRLAERASKLDELRLALDLRRLALVDNAESDGVLQEASAIVDLHITTIERRKSWEAVLPIVQELAGSTRRWLVPNLVGVPSDVYAGRLRDAVLTLKPFSRTQTITLGARQLAGLDLTALPCRLFLMTAAEAASALDTEWPQRVRERLEVAHARLAIDGGSASLATAFGASLRTPRDPGARSAA